MRKLVGLPLAILVTVPAIEIFFNVGLLSIPLIGLTFVALSYFLFHLKRRLTTGGQFLFASSVALVTYQAIFALLIITGSAYNTLISIPTSALMAAAAFFLTFEYIHTYRRHPASKFEKSCTKLAHCWIHLILIGSIVTFAVIEFQMIQVPCCFSL